VAKSVAGFCAVGAVFVSKRLNMPSKSRLKSNNPSKTFSLLVRFAIAILLVQAS
jgi:hypothetical protein